MSCILIDFSQHYKITRIKKRKAYKEILKQLSKEDLLKIEKLLEDNE